MIQLRKKERELLLKFRPASDAELKAALGEDIPQGYVAGWASTIALDSYRDVVVSGAFDQSIKERGLEGPKGVKLLIGHDWNKPAGVIKVLETRNGDLWIEAQMELEISYVKDFYLALKAAGGMSFSIGFRLQDYEFKEDAQERMYLEIKRGDLYEVSMVPFPANDECIMEFIKSQKSEGEDEDLLDNTDPPKSLAEFEKRLVASGIVKTRNDARRITLEVATNVSLFKKKGEQEPVSETHDEPKVEPIAPEEPVELTKLKTALARLEALA